MQLFKTIRAEAHCDIPCGIYDPTTAKIAAKTVARMIEQITELPMPKEPVEKPARDAYIQAVSRRVRVKEEHAETCKRELAILWADFFKPEHLEKHPMLHDMFWKALKLASKCKQDPHKEDAEALLEHVDAIAKLFYEVKGIPEKYDAYKKITDSIY
jgi:nickel superoxide dismutase